jgi:hypothetical protein
MVSQQVPLINKKMTSYLNFTVPPAEIDGFILDLGTLTVNDDIIRLSPLKFQKTHRYSYFPFIFADHLWDY